MTKPSVNPDFERVLKSNLRDIICLYPKHPWRFGVNYQPNVPRLVFANTKGKPVAYLERQGRTGFQVYVYPQYRRQGIATRLLDVAKQQWPELDTTTERYTPKGLARIGAYHAREQREENDRFELHCVPVMWCATLRRESRE